MTTNPKSEIHPHERRFLSFVLGMVEQAQNTELKRPYRIQVCDNVGNQLFETEVIGIEDGVPNLEVPWGKAEKYDQVEITFLSDGETMWAHTFDLTKDLDAVEPGTKSEPAAGTRKAASVAR